MKISWRHDSISNQLFSLKNVRFESKSHVSVLFLNISFDSLKRWGVYSLWTLVTLRSWDGAYAIIVNPGTGAEEIQGEFAFSDGKSVRLAVNGNTAPEAENALKICVGHEFYFI